MYQGPNAQAQAASQPVNNAHSPMTQGTPGIPQQVQNGMTQAAGGMRADNAALGNGIHPLFSALAQHAAQAAATGQQMHPLAQALMSHLAGNMQGSPIAAGGGNPALGGVGMDPRATTGMGGGMQLRGTAESMPGLPGPNMGAMAGALQPGYNSAIANMQQAAQAMRGQQGGVNGSPMGMYGSFYGGSMPQASAASALGGGLRMKNGDEGAQ